MNETSGAADAFYCLDEQIGYLLRLSSQRHATIFQRRALAGLTPTQFAALARLSEYPHCSQNQLGRLAAMDAATIKGVVDRLRRRGLIRTEASPEDRRRSLISLTGEGVTLLAEMKTAGLRISSETLEPLTAPEQRTLLRILKKIC